MTAPTIYTIGHSNHPIEHFLSLLGKNAITVLADVRSTPFSRFNPQFNREKLARSLAEHGIRYEFLGEELGARSKDPACYEDGRVSYRKLAETSLFQHGVQRVLSLAAAERVALMCAEKDPLECHRMILVTPELVRRGSTVTHLLADGKVETNAEAVKRLRERLKLAQEDLFGGDDYRDEAYALQARKIAYKAK